MSIIVGWLVVGLVSALYLLGVLFAFLAGSSPEPGRPTRVLLVLLRLAIGWHFFIEGMDKLHTPGWSSAGYLRESTGPLAPQFRALAGDPLVEALTVQDGPAISDSLDRDWQNYFQAFAAFYQMDSKQTGEAHTALDRVKKQAAELLATGEKNVEMVGPYPPAFKKAMTVEQQLAEYRVLQDKVREVEDDDLPLYGSAAFEKWKTAKANANRWRAGLQKDLLFLNKRMKRSLRDVLFEILDEQLPADQKKKIQTEVKKARDAAGKEVAADPKDWDAIDRIEDKRDDKIIGICRAVFMPSNGVKPELSAQAERIRDNILEPRGKDQPSFDPLMVPVAKPWRQWDMLDWSDRIVKFGLAAVGVMLLIGLATRGACVAGATYLLLFFLAMPPLPGWPESPKAEGHYLFINKNVIEMLALLALATTRSGRWSGLDGVMQFLLPRRWRKPVEAGKMT